MSAGSFFVGLGAGVAILAVPVLTLTPAREIPRQVIGWIEGPPPSVAQVTAQDAAVARPMRGYRAGDPTPAPDGAPPPTLAPSSKPTAVPAPVAAQPAVVPISQSGGSGIKTGVIHSGGAPVVVRRIAGVDSSADPALPDGSPVLVSTGIGMQAAGQDWRAIRALGGITGWVPSAQLTVDGEPAPLQVATAVASPTPAAGVDRAAIANTDGAGVVLRNTPNDADRTTRGLMDGAAVTVLERQGADWAHVRADNGQTGWIPTRYLVGA